MPYTIKCFLLRNPITGPLCRKISVSRKAERVEAKFRCTKLFTDRSKGSDKLCIVLAGYKPFLYDAVFGRIKEYLPKDIDMCVVTSGLYSDEIARLCEENEWSYLSTQENHVSLVQNVAIRLHPKAKYIFKLDEDIFVTEHFFEKMLAAYVHAEAGMYIPGVVAPILPINGYGYTRVLEKLNATEAYKDRFGNIKCAAGYRGRRDPLDIEYDPEVARFFWGEGGVIPSIDEMNALFEKGPMEERPCPIRFSIGAILFKRETWELMGYYDVDRAASSMGRDEEQICAFCTVHSMPIMVSENIVAGHFSFGPQTEAMKEYFEKHPKRFAIG